jgi:hypothetical protein
MTRRDVRRWGLAAFVAGAVVWAVALFVDAQQAWLAYLVAVMAALTVTLGALMLVLMAHLTGATWFVVLRRVAESVAAATAVLVVLLVPLVFGLHALYPWLSPDQLEPHVREMVLRKHAYLNVPFFLIRAAIYIAAWLLILARVRRWSSRQDAGQQPGPIAGFSAAACIVIGFTLSFAAFDWMMSLRPDWYSTMYGVRVFAGTFVPALGLIAVLMRAGRLPVTPGHAQALASLLLSFVIFWFYIAFGQLLIIWIGNAPAEITWYVARSRPAWLVFGSILAVGHFAIPFLMLLFRRVKRNARTMARLGAWLLAMHYLDLCWLVIPDAGHVSWASVWIYPSALLLTCGAAAVLSTWWLGDVPVLPERDPDLADSLEYEYEES